MIVVVDTGGTKTLVASFNNRGLLLKSTKFPTPKDTSEYIKALIKVLADEYSDQPTSAIVIAVPGIVKDGVAILCPNLGWKNFNITHALRGVLNNAPIVVENDANLAGLAETRLLRTSPKQSIYITISTGIGTGIITDGHINPALKNSESGHMLLEHKGKLREWETFGSGRAIKKEYKMFAADIRSKRAWNKIVKNMSKGFLVFIPVLQPDIIIIGGSIGTYFDRYADELKTVLKRNLPPYIPVPKIVQAKHPEQAVVYGGYYHALDTFGNKK